MQRIFYITNDVERAAVPMSIEGVEYHIITFRNPFSEYLSKPTQTGTQTDAKLYNIFLVDGPKVSTEELMKRPEVEKYIKAQRHKGTKAEKPNIVVFKPTVEIEEFCEVMGWKLLNPFSRISEECEEKISQIKLLKSLKVPVPKYATAPLGKCGFEDLKRKLGTPLILQYNLGHTGEGTLVVKSEKDLEALKKKFPKRPVRISEFIHGVPVTVNAVVGKKIYISSPSLQITGVPLLTLNKFATVGNDWSWFSKSSKQKTVNKKLIKIVDKVGSALKKRGFRGAFGVDVMRDQSGKLYVIEVNSRQPASVMYESELQKTINNKQPTKGITTIELHLKCLLQKDTGKEKLPETLEGSQIFVRAKKELKWKMTLRPKIVPRLAQGDNSYFVFSKLNKGDVVKRNAELLRIQSRTGMIEQPMRLKRSVERLLKVIL